MCIISTVREEVGGATAQEQRLSRVCSNEEEMCHKLVTCFTLVDSSRSIIPPRPGVMSVCRCVGVSGTTEACHGERQRGGCRQMRVFDEECLILVRRDREDAKFENLERYLTRCGSDDPLHEIMREDLYWEERWMLSPYFGGRSEERDELTSSGKDEGILANIGRLISHLFDGPTRFMYMGTGSRTVKGKKKTFREEAPESNLSSETSLWVCSASNLS